MQEGAGDALRAPEDAGVSSYHRLFFRRWKLMEKVKFKVPNMECKSCANAIEKKLKSMAGVKAVDIDIQKKMISIQHENPNLCQEDLTCAVEDMGYKVQVP
jgi:copper chaperone CopZ